MKTALLKHFTIALFMFSVILLSAAPLMAQQSNCAPRDIVIERLMSGYGETRQSIGLSARGQAVEVFASDETGTWTITVTSPNGVSCLVASGQSFETLTESLPAPGDEA